MKQIVMINGSPRIKESTSKVLLKELEKHLGEAFEIHNINVSHSILQKKQQEAYECMKQADIFVIAFPLYVYCLPSSLQEFLVGYSSYVSKETKTTQPSVYAMVNCGFPEARINADALAVIEQFTKEIAGTYRLGMMIGGGGMLLPMKKFPPVKRSWKRIHESFEQIKEDMINGVRNTNDYDKNTVIEIDSSMNKKLFYFFAEANFKYFARKNGLKKAGIYERPYL